nr:hypothetical protein [Tanacetum cinerariifolium]
MGRDIIQLETALSTISQEYLLEFTFEYGISEDVHPELPGPEERIMDFLKGKVGVDERVFPTVVDWCTNALKDETQAVNTYSRADMAVLNTRRTPIQKQPETLLCLVGLSQRYFLGDDVYPTFLHDGDRDMDLFNLIGTPNPSKVKTGLCPHAAHEVPLLTDTASRVIDMEDPDAETESSGTPSAIEKCPLDFDNENPSSPMTEGVASEVSLEEEVAAMEPCLSKKQDRRVNDRADANAPSKVLRKDYASVRPEQSTRGGKSLPTMRTAATPGAKHDLVSLSRFRPKMWQPWKCKTRALRKVQGQEIDLFLIHGWVTQRYLSARMGRDQQLLPGHPGRIQDVVDHIVPPGCLFELCHMPNPEFLSQYNKNLAQQVAMDSQLRLRFKQEEIQGLQNQTSNLKTLLESVADMKKAAETKNADLTKELESLRTQFLELQVSNAQLTQQVSNLQTQVTGEERIKAAFEEFKKAFVNVVSVGISKGMSKGLAHGIEHGKASRGLEVMEAYDLESNINYLQVLQELKDLKYPIVDQLESLKDAPMKAIKEEMLLKEASAANVSRAEKKKRCRVVCHTHGIGSAHHARSDGVPVSVPIVAPQGLAILLVDVSTQTETFEDDASPRLLRSKSLPPMYNLDWP